MVDNDNDLGSEEHKEKRAVLVGSASSFARAATTKVLLESAMQVEVVASDKKVIVGTSGHIDHGGVLPNLRLEDYDPSISKRHINRSPNGKRNQPCRCGSGKKTKKCCGSRMVK